MIHDSILSSHEHQQFYFRRKLIAKCAILCSRSSLGALGSKLIIALNTAVIVLIGVNLDVTSALYRIYVFQPERRNSVATIISEI